MRVFFAVASLVCLLGCTSTTVGPGVNWGTVAGISFTPVDGFFILGTDSTSGDYNFIVIAADQPGYCNVLLQNTAGYLANINYAIFTYSNPVGTGAFDPLPGGYPVTAAPGPSASAQVTFGSTSNCTTTTTDGTDGSVVLQGVAVDYSQLLGSLDVGFGTSGSLAGSFTAPLCDISNSPQGPSTCFQ